jgi:S1-C subfamily serine protease
MTRRVPLHVRVLTSSVAAVAALVLVATGGSFASAAVGSASRTATTGVVVVRSTFVYGGQGAGTGIVLTSSGEVLTNNHVIRGARSIRVTVTSSGRTYAATVAGYSVSKDIALLELKNASGLDTALVGSSSSLRVGDAVTAVGNAGGTGVLTAKTGTVVKLGRSITVNDDDGSSTRLTGLVETDAPLRPGDSGGPLLKAGRVVGIDAAATTGIRYPGAAGEGYAITIDTALGVVRRIEAGRTTGTVHVGPTAFLGVSLAPGSPQGTAGASVQGVSPGSPAQTAGIEAGDLITSFAGSPVRTATSLRNRVLRLVPGRLVRVTWLDRATGSTTARVRLVAGPPQ